MNNETIRKEAKRLGIHLWQIAFVMAVSEATLTRWLRLPLSVEREKAFLDAINKIKEGRE